MCLILLVVLIAAVIVGVGVGLYTGFFVPSPADPERLSRVPTWLLLVVGCVSVGAVFAGVALGC